VGGAVCDARDVDSVGQTRVVIVVADFGGVSMKSSRVGDGRLAGQRHLVARV
jgi:hypothetical protein